MRREPPEQKLHRSVAQYCAAVLPRAVFWTTFPAGGGGRLRGAVLNGMGLKPGVPDLMFIWQSRAYMIELKSQAGRLSPEQTNCHQHLLEAGASVATCRSLDEVAAAFAMWGFPTREIQTRRLDDVNHAK